MRNILFFTVFCLLSIPAIAQPKGYQPIKNSPAFQQQLAKTNAVTQTITSDFTQTKNMALLAEKIRSKGKFYFKKEDKVRIEYTNPYTYLVVMNAGQLMVKDETKTSKINTKNSKLMQSVNRIIIDCMRGTVFQNADFTTTTFENGQGYLLSLIPATDAMKKMFKQIDVYMDKKQLDVTKLVMSETGGDYTNMDFTNTQHNVALNEAIFKVK